MKKTAFDEFEKERDYDDSWSETGFLITSKIWSEIYQKRLN